MGAQPKAITMRFVDRMGGVRELEVVEPRGLFGRMRGLLGQTGLEPGRGMLIKAKQVHTIGMRFPIDSIYLSRAGSVLRVETLSPGKVGPFVPRARWVLEVKAGEAARLGIAPGLTLLPRKPGHGEPSRPEGDLQSPRPTRPAE